MSKTETFIYRSSYPCTAQQLYDYHAAPGALERLLPPWENTHVVRKEGTIAPGGKVELRIKLGPVPLTWEAHHIEDMPGRMFKDIQYRGPFSLFEHTHTFTTVEGGAQLEDRINFQLPCSAITPSVIAHKIKQKLTRNFTYRAHVLEEDLQLHQKYSRKKLNILISGASGILGQTLVPLLTTGGHEVFKLVRRKPVTANNEIYWDPDKGEIDTEAIVPPDAVIHLAGEYIGLSRWSDEKKRRVMDSRVKGTTLLAETVSSLTKKPDVFVSASAVGYYGHNGSRLLTEGDGCGDDYISTVCGAWEQAASTAADNNIRTVTMRLGVGLTPKGGALERIISASPFAYIRYFGGGDQYISWISLDDMAAAILHCVCTPELSGPVNIAAPAPVTNRELIRSISYATGRPRVHPLPGSFLRLLYGDMADQILLSSCRVSSEKLVNSGFSFRHPDLDETLRILLGRNEKYT